VDLNYLYYRQQVSMTCADRAACSASRKAHLGLANLYQARIESFKRVVTPQPITPVSAGGTKTFRPKLSKGEDSPKIPWGIAGTIAGPASFAETSLISKSNDGARPAANR
jgi:hypothetical protein